MGERVPVDSCSRVALGKDVFNFAIELRDYQSSDTVQRPIIGVVGSFHLPEAGYMIDPCASETCLPFCFADLNSLCWPRIRHRSVLSCTAAAF